MSSGGAMMSRAQLVTQDATIDITAVATRLGSADPFDVLVDRLRPMAARAVDALQIAAKLESSGVTDRAARVEFGYVDVFDLAREIHRRVAPAADPPRPRTVRHWGAQARDIGHGATYLLPAALFPGAFATLKSPSLIIAVVVVGAIGWVWSGATAWLAYQMLGEARPGSAGDLLRWSSLAALPVAAGVAAVIADLTDVGYGLVTLALAQMGYQMAAAVLTLYRRDGLLLASMLPAVVGGIGYLILGPVELLVAVASALGSIAVTFALAIRETFTGGGRRDVVLPHSLHGRLRPLGPVVAYTMLSAAFFLYPQARHLLDRFDIAIALLPAIVGMGVVEWRVRGFHDEVRGLLARVRHPRPFVRRVWLRVLGGLGLCVAVVSVLAAGLLAVLDRTGRLSAAGVVMAAAAVALAGAYYLGFLLANMGRYGWLCGSLLACLGVYAAAARAAGDALTDTTAFLGATLLLIVLYAAGLAGGIAQARRYR